MTNFTFRPLVLGTLATFMFAGAAAAQNRAAVLNTFDVQKLVASGTAEDNAKLSAHFSALAERYTTDAKRHEAMARSFAANPNRNTGAGMSAHCKRLTTLNNESGATLRELATHHQKLAAGAASTAPRDGAQFQGGAGAPEPTEAELKALAANANTPGDHRALAEYFHTAAKRYTADAAAHVTLAQSYRGTKMAQAAMHCDRVVSLSRDAAKEASAAAEMHSQLATVGR